MSMLKHEGLIYKVRFDRLNSNQKVSEKTFTKGSAGLQL